MSKAHKAEAYDRVVRERDLIELALADTLSNRVVWGKWAADPCAGKHRCGVSRVDGAMGGLMILQFRAEGQSDIVNVELLEAGERRLFEGRQYSDSYQPLLDSLADALQKARNTAAAA